MSQAVAAQTADQLPVAPTPAIAASPMLTMLHDAIQRGMSIDIIREIKAMAKEFEADDVRRQFDTAIAAAKAEIEPVVRTRDGHNSKYADFAAIATAVDPILSRHGLSYRHRSPPADKIIVVCRLAHKGGYFEETQLSAPADTSGSKNAIQALGSTLTYLQRYTLLLALGLSTAHDDNGKAAGNGEVISEDQLSELRILIEAKAADIEKFCAYFKIEALPDLKAKDFARAVTSLKAKGVK